MFQVVETHHRTLVSDGNIDKRGKRHVRSVNYAMTENKDSDDESETGEEQNKRLKRKKSGMGRKIGNSQSLSAGKTSLSKTATKTGLAQGTLC